MVVHQVVLLLSTKTLRRTKHHRAQTHPHQQNSRYVLLLLRHCLCWGLCVCLTP